MSHFFVATQIHRNHNLEIQSIYVLFEPKKNRMFQIHSNPRLFGRIQMGGQIPKRYRKQLHLSNDGEKNLRFFETATAERLEKREKKTFNGSVKSGRNFHSRILPSLKLTASLPLKMGLNAPKGNEKVFQPSIFKVRTVKVSR